MLRDSDNEKAVIGAIAYLSSSLLYASAGEYKYNEIKDDLDDEISKAYAEKMAAKGYIN